MSEFRNSQSQNDFNREEATFNPYNSRNQNLPHYSSSNPMSDTFEYKNDSKVVFLKATMEQLNGELLLTDTIQTELHRYDEFIDNVINYQALSPNEVFDVMDKLISDMNDMATQFMKLKKMTHSAALLLKALDIIDANPHCELGPKIKVVTQNHLGYCITQANINSPFVNELDDKKMNETAALDYLQQASNLIDKYNIEDCRASNCLNFSKVYADIMNDHQNALTYAKKAVVSLEISQKKLSGSSQDFSETDPKLQNEIMKQQVKQLGLAYVKIGESEHYLGNVSNCQGSFKKSTGILRKYLGNEEPMLKKYERNYQAIQGNSDRKENKNLFARKRDKSLRSSQKSIKENLPKVNKKQDTNQRLNETDPNYAPYPEKRILSGKVNTNPSNSFYKISKRPSVKNFNQTTKNLPISKKITRKDQQEATEFISTRNKNMFFGDLCSFVGPKHNVYKTVNPQVTDYKNQVMNARRENYSNLLTSFKEGKTTLTDWGDNFQHNTKSQQKKDVATMEAINEEVKKRQEQDMEDLRINEEEFQIQKNEVMGIWKKINDKIKKDEQEHEQLQKYEAKIRAEERDQLTKEFQKQIEKIKQQNSQRETDLENKCQRKRDKKKDLLNKMKLQSQGANNQSTEVNNLIKEIETAKAEK